MRSALLVVTLVNLAHGEGLNFAGCAQIGISFECGHTLLTDSGGVLLIKDAGKFQVGDVVFATGTITKDCDLGLPEFCDGIPCLIDAKLGTCFEECGTLVQGVECVLFHGQSGLYVLQNLGSFVVGDIVRVAGSVDPACATFCLQGDGCVLSNSIESCQLVSTCGTIVQPPFCGLALATDEGGLWLLDDTSGFGLGDRVFVDGRVVDPCFTLPECQVGGCIDVALVEPCGASFFSGCGVVVDSFACGLSLAADDGSGIYVLADFGGTDVGDRVFVQGFIEPECPDGLGFCACIDNEGVSPCSPVGDLNGDGLVNGADLGLLLGAWGTCDPLQIGCFGDLNFDGLIDGADLGALLAHWTG